MRTGRGAGTPRAGNGGYPYRGDEAPTLAVVDYEAPTIPPPGPPPTPPPHERQLWPWLLVLLVLVLAGAGAAYALTRGGGQHQARVRQTIVVTRAVLSATSTSPAKRPSVRKAVPSVLGLPVAKAVALLVKQGFVAQERRLSAQQAKGTVLSQKPAPQVKLARGGVVLLSVSAGPGLAVLPSLLGQSEGAAQAALTSLGLQIDAVPVLSTQVAGTVVAQSPKGGRQAAEGNEGAAERRNRHTCSAGNEQQHHDADDFRSGAGPAHGRGAGGQRPHPERGSQRPAGSWPRQRASQRPLATSCRDSHGPVAEGRRRCQKGQPRLPHCLAGWTPAAVATTAAASATAAAGGAERAWAGRCFRPADAPSGWVRRQRGRLTDDRSEQGRHCRRRATRRRNDGSLRLGRHHLHRALLPNWLGTGKFPPRHTLGGHAFARRLEFDFGWLAAAQLATEPAQLQYREPIALERSVRPGSK
jgi:hypothetical protein